MRGQREEQSFEDGGRQLMSGTRGKLDTCEARGDCEGLCEGLEGQSFQLGLEWM